MLITAIPWRCMSPLSQGSKSLSAVLPLIFFVRHQQYKRDREISHTTEGILFLTLSFSLLGSLFFRQAVENIKLLDK